MTEISTEFIKMRQTLIEVGKGMEKMKGEEKRDKYTYTNRHLEWR